MSKTDTQSNRPCVYIDIGVGAANLYFYDQIYEITPKPWIIQVNQKFYPRGLRRSAPRIITINGRKLGEAYYSFGLQPRYYYLDYKSDLKAKLLKFCRRRLGLFCSNIECGYHRIEIAKVVYNAYSLVLKNGDVIYEVRTMHDNYAICSITINKERDHCKVAGLLKGRQRSICLIATYIFNAITLDEAYIHTRRQARITA